MRARRTNRMRLPNTASDDDGTVAFASAYHHCTVQMKKTVDILRYLPSFLMVEISGFEPLTS